jgi:hypothetical protein
MQSGFIGSATIPQNHVVALIAAGQKLRVAEIPATRSFNEFAVAGEAGRRALAP